MPKRLKETGPQPAHDWYLRDWMKARRVTQAQLSKKTGWGKSKTNDIYHGRTGYYRQILNEAAFALNLRPFELLMHPEDAAYVHSLIHAQKGLSLAHELAAIVGNDQDELRRASG